MLSAKSILYIIQQCGGNYSPIHNLAISTSNSFGVFNRFLFLFLLFFLLFVSIAIIIIIVFFLINL